MPLSPEQFAELIQSQQRLADSLTKLSEALTLQAASQGELAAAIADMVAGDEPDPEATLSGRTIDVIG